MSSMFKKKSGAGFKPKAPIARPRPAAAKPAAKPTISKEPAPSTDAPVEETVEQPTPDQSASQSDPASQPTARTTDAGNEASEASAQPAPNVAAAPAPTATPAPSSASATQATITTTTTLRAGGDTEAPASEAAAEAPENRSQSPAEAATADTPTTQATTSAAASSTNASTPSTRQKPAAKKAPAKRGGKRAVASVEDAEPADGEQAEAPTKKRRGPAKRRTRAATNEEAGDEEEETQTTKRKPRQRKRPAENGEEGPTPRKRRERSPTPEDAESQVVDLTTMTMSDLTKDLRIGRKSKHHDMLVERERAKTAAARQRRAASLVEGGATPAPDSQTPVPGKEPGATPGFTPQPVQQPASMEGTGPSYEIVDGQIVVNQSSLALDRHARDAQRNGHYTDIREEDSFTNHVTETSFRTGSKINGPNIWSPEDTELFYTGLQMLGTDFQMISKMFPGRSRRHVKMKFNREEKTSPDRIHSALVGEKTVKFDLDVYKQWTKAEYEPVEDIMNAQKAAQAKHDAEQKLRADEKAEEMRKKKEALFADDENGEEGGKKKKKRKKKGQDSGAWGEVVEETIIEG